MTNIRPNSATYETFGSESKRQSSVDAAGSPDGLALSVSDLSTEFGNEPRIQDLTLARHLGFGKIHNIRKVIKRHRSALEAFGEVFSNFKKPSAAGGRPGTAFYLNRKQMLYVAAKSDTPLAGFVTIKIVEIFDAWASGRALPPRGAATEDLSRVVRAAPTAATAPVLVALAALVPEVGNVWSGTPAALLRALVRPFGVRDWPRMPQGLTARLKLLEPVLPDHGLALNRYRGEVRTVFIERKAEAPPLTLAVALPATNPLGVVHGWDAIGAELGLTGAAAMRLGLPVFTLDGHACSRREELRAWLDRKGAAARAALTP